MHYPDEAICAEAPSRDYYLSEAKSLLERAERETHPRQSLEVQQAHRIGMLEADLNNAMQRLRETEQERNHLRATNESADRNATYAATRYTELVDRHNALRQKHEKLVAKTAKKPVAKKRTVKK